MKKLTLALVVTLGVVCTAYSQYMTINYDLEKNYFNEGQPLPAEKTLMFTGLVPQGVDIIEISILRPKRRATKIASTWLRGKTLTTMRTRVTAWLSTTG